MAGNRPTQEEEIFGLPCLQEWRHLYQGDHSSGSVEAQHDRWKKFLTQWERALSENKEVIVAMDANIDFLRWTSDSLQPGVKPLVQDLSLISSH